MIKKKPENKDVSSKDIALSLIKKMVEYERNIDKKENPTAAEKRHVEFLRGMRKYH